jgi:hypothetical protein
LDRQSYYSESAADSHRLGTSGLPENADPGTVSGELRISAREFESGKLSHRAAASVATDEPSRPEGFTARLNSYTVLALCEISDRHTTS